jgi:hypothetical protein
MTNRSTNKRNTSTTEQQAVDTSTANANGSQDQPENEELSRVLQEQINQAIQPVLEDFRHQLETAVQTEVEQVDGQAEEAVAAQAAAASSESTEKPTSQKEDSESRSEKQTPQKPSKPEGKTQGGDEHRIQGLMKTARPSIGSAVDLVEQQAEHLLQSLMVAGVAVVLSEATRDAIERGAEQGIQQGLKKTTAPLGNKASVREFRAQAETALIAILHETLDAIYAEEFQAKVREHAESTGRDIAHRNISGAIQHLREVLQMVLQEVMTVLRTQWHRLLRLLLNVLLASLDDTPARAERTTKSRTTSSKTSTTSKKSEDK